MTTNCRVDSEFRHHPGAIEALAQHPAEADQVSRCVVKLSVSFVNLATDQSIQLTYTVCRVLSGKNLKATIDFGCMQKMFYAPLQLLMLYNLRTYMLTFVLLGPSFILLYMYIVDRSCLFSLFPLLTSKFLHTYFTQLT